MEKDGPSVNYLFFMDDLKMSGKSVKEIDSLVQTVHQCSRDTKGGARDFAAVVLLKRGKGMRSEGIMLSDGDEMGEPDANGYKCLGVFELDKIFCEDMKVKVRAT